MVSDAHFYPVTLCRPFQQKALNHRASHLGTMFRPQNSHGSLQAHKKLQTISHRRAVGRQWGIRSFTTMGLSYQVCSHC